MTSISDITSNHQQVESSDDVPDEAEQKANDLFTAIKQAEWVDIKFDRDDAMDVLNTLFLFKRW